MPITLQDIRAARERIRDAIYHSPCPYSLSLSRLCGCDIYCKLDHLQMTGSFKERGARNKLLQLPPARRGRGVIAASAGNHALGLAYHGQLLSVPVVVVMPHWAPLVKVRNCRGFGAEIIFHGDSFDEAYRHAQALAEERGLTFVPGFDDPDIIAGQGTLGLEILEDVPGVEAVVVPVGGGGLIAGVGAAVKALRPEVEIVGVEPEHAPTLAASLRAGRVTRVQARPTLADGLAIAQLGELCFETIRPTLDDLILVDEATIARSVLRLLEFEKMVLEGAGAVPLAAVLHRPADGRRDGGAGGGGEDGGISQGVAGKPRVNLRGKKVVLVLSGGNIDVTVISRIIERGLAADGRLCRVAVRLGDRPGSLAALTRVLADAGASVKEVNHDRNFGPADVASVGVSCIVETRDFEHIRRVKEALDAAGIDGTVG